MPDGYLALDTQQIVPVLVEAFKAQSKRYEDDLAASSATQAEQARKIADLQEQLARLAARLEQLERN